MLHHRQVPVKPENPTLNQVLGWLSQGTWPAQAAMHIARNEIVMGYRPKCRICNSDGEVFVHCF